MKEKRILAGITKDNELYFLEIEKKNNNGHFSMSSDTSKPIKRSEAVDRCREWLEDDTESWIEAVKNNSTELGHKEWAEWVIKNDGDLVSFDNSLFDLEVEVDGEAWLFESQSCGQHEEKDLKHYFINENLFKQLMQIWQRYHLKELPENSAMSIVEEALGIKQDFEALAIEAIKIINE